MGEINTSKLFIDLFNIYEEELLSIFQYVAPISQNINGNISGNRIHELHIRICSEVENLAKTILEKYEYISHDITNNMVSCLKILNEHFNTCNKKIYFCQSMNFDEDKQLYQPLQQENKKKVTPRWWTNYNDMKHHKVEKYLNCGLGDVINSLGAYYILLNYLIIDVRKPLHKEHIIKSQIFKPTIGWIQYPNEILNKYAVYRDNNGDFKDIILNGEKIIPIYYNEPELVKLEPIITQANQNKEIGELGDNTPSSIDSDNYFFYKSLFQEPYVMKTNEGDIHLRRLKWITKFNI